MVLVTTSGLMGHSLPTGPFIRNLTPAAIGSLTLDFPRNATTACCSPATSFRLADDFRQRQWVAGLAGGATVEPDKTVVPRLEPGQYSVCRWGRLTAAASRPRFAH